MDDNAGSFEDVLKRASPDLITIRDALGTVLFASDSVAEVLGVEPDDFIGSDCFEFVHPDDLERFRDEAGMGAPDSPSLEHRMRHSDGSWRWVETHTRRQSDSVHGELFVGVTRDITSRVDLEQKINRQKVLREAAAAVSPLAIIALDEAGQVLSCMGALFGMEGAAAFTELRDNNEAVASAAILAVSGTNSNLELVWKEQSLESRFITLVGHSVGSIRAVCLFLPSFQAGSHPQITRH